MGGLRAVLGEPERGSARECMEVSLRGVWGSCIPQRPSVVCPVALCFHIFKAHLMLASLVFELEFIHIIFVCLFRIQTSMKSFALHNILIQLWTLLLLTRMLTLFHPAQFCHRSRACS